MTVDELIRTIGQMRDAAKIDCVQPYVYSAWKTDEEERDWIRRSFCIPVSTEGSQDRHPRTANRFQIRAKNRETDELQIGDTALLDDFLVELQKA